MKYDRLIPDDVIAEQNPNISSATLIALAMEFANNGIILDVKSTSNKKEPKTMATTLANPQAPATESNVTSDRTDYIVGFLLKDKKGVVLEEKAPAFFPVSSDEEITAVAKLKDDGAFAPVFQITTSIPRAKNAAGMAEICPDEEERANNFNRGAKQKANNRLKARLLVVNEDGSLAFDPNGADEDGKPNLTNGVLDMTAEIASASKRKVLTEEEKLDRFLEGFPENTRNLMKQAYLASRQAPAA